MKRCTVIRHVAFEDLDLLEPCLRERGFDIVVVDAARDGLGAIDPLQDELLVVLGGPIGVYDQPDFPFMTDEIALLSRRLQADRATLGICLGAQAMAAALGAKVYPNPMGKEIGWSGLALTPEGQASPLDVLGETPVLHWHGDVMELPHGAVRLAATPQTPTQAFSWGQRGLALQFHVEVSAAGLERWYVGHVGEIAATADIDVASLRAAARAHAPAMTRLAPALFGRWLDQVCG